MHLKLMELLPVLPTVIILLLGLCLFQEGAEGLTCWRCHNGYKPSKSCERRDGEKLMVHVDTTKDEEKVSAPDIVLVDSGEKECKTIQEFFTKYSIVSADWLKRLDSERQASTTVEDPYCVSLFVRAESPAQLQVYRDCIKGDWNDIQAHFEKMLELNNVKKDDCTTKNVQADGGVKTVKACICSDKDKCNDHKDSGAHRNQWFGLSSLALSTIVVAIINQSILSN